MEIKIQLYKRPYGESTPVALTQQDLSAVKVLTHSQTTAPSYTLVSGLLEFNLADTQECSELYITFSANTQPSRIRTYINQPLSAQSVDLGSCTVVELSSPEPEPESNETNE